MYFTNFSLQIVLSLNLFKQQYTSDFAQDKVYVPGDLLKRANNLRESVTGLNKKIHSPPLSGSDFSDFYSQEPALKVCFISDTNKVNQ